jgi:TolB-like protein/class 3 adenylate cyclase
MVEERPDRVKRRLAAILAADVANYSRLMGLDEAGTACTLREHRAATDTLVAKHGGRIVKTMGDGVLIEFPSAVDAVEYAVASQSMMAERNAGVPEDRRLLFRVGINLGEVLVQSDNDILGDSVNVAARIEGIAEPGGICISASAHDHVRGTVAVEFADLGEQALKNIARPVRVYRVISAGIGSNAPAAAYPAPRLSMAVLPFANLSGDPEQDYFVDGVTESLTTDMSRITGGFVIARNTAFSYKDKSPDVRQLGRELRVRYVLEGSVQRAGNRMRVNVQLIDAGTGNHLWADRFDKPVADLFDMQDEIVARLAGQLGVQLARVEARRADSMPHPDALDLCFQGLALLHKGRTHEILAKARGFFERALALEPANVFALVGAAAVDVVVASSLMTDNPTARLAAAEAALTKALSLAPNYAPAHLLLGSVYNLTNRAAQAIGAGKHALALDRNLAPAYAEIGVAKTLLGRADETEAHILEALRLSPRDNLAYAWMTVAGIAKSLLASDEEAVGWLRRSIEANRNWSLTHFHLSDALANLGRLEEARAAVQAGLALDPKFTIRRASGLVMSNNPTSLAQLKRIGEGMRNAGAPEGGLRRFTTE